MFARDRLVLVTIALLASACGGAGGQAQIPQAPVDVSVATTAPVARREEPALAPVGRPVVVVFRASWAAASRVVDAQTLADPRVKAALADVDISYVDATDADDPEVGAALAREEVSALPCIVVHAAGDPAPGEHLNGVVTVEALLAALERASR